MHSPVRGVCVCEKEPLPRGLPGEASPHHAVPTTLRYAYLPKPAVANLLQVQEAVPAQVRGLEELHYIRTGDSGTA